MVRARDWPEADGALMLQCVLTGKAQEAYSTLSLEDRSSCSKIKSAVLNAYELAPGAYRQHFRTWARKTSQTYVEFARDPSIHFKRWLITLDVTTFADLPFFIETDTGDPVLGRGVGLRVLPVPLYKLVLGCDLVKGDTVVGVRPALLIEGVHFILGNGLARLCENAETDHFLKR